MEARRKRRRIIRLMTIPRAGDALSESDHVYAKKLGGYPSNLQHAVECPNDDFGYVLQIDSEARIDLSWADHGIVYVGGGVSDRSRWAVSCQSY